MSPLPQNQFNDVFERTRGRSLDGKLETLEITGKPYERSSSNLEKRFPEMLLSPSMEDFANSVKKRSSDVLEDLRHLESKSTEDGEINPNMLTRKTSFIWEDLKSLEARRQDTFSDSVKSFSRQRIDVPGISISMEGRKTYIVEPKINIDENSDSILKTLTYNKNNSNNNSYDGYNNDNDRESKLGVWTKVKPRKRNDNGRRSSERALKIIQENSAILQKILTCQARKRLPDLEEISKQITISPINEEISKIFSPILEKMGLNEHEINEELARINFKDNNDRTTTTTTASEFEAKINDELSKLSLIGDNEEVAYLPDVVDDLGSNDYLLARDAFIDHQINEELSKLLVNYSNDPVFVKNKPYSSSYESSSKVIVNSDNNSNKDDLSYVHRHIDHDLSITTNGVKKNDHKEMEKLDQTFYDCEVVIPTKNYSKSTVLDDPPTNSYDKNSYSFNTSSYEYQSSRISPRKIPSNPYSVRSNDSKFNFDSTGFENTTFEMTTKAAARKSYDSMIKQRPLSKEHLEFRVKYDSTNDDDKDVDKNLSPRARQHDVDLKLNPLNIDDASYRSNRYSSNYNEETSLKTSSIGTSGSDYETTMFLRKYENMSPKIDGYSSSICNTNNYDLISRPYKVTTLDPEVEVAAYLTGITSDTKRYRETNVSSPNDQYLYSKSSSNDSYITITPDSLDDPLTRIRTTYCDVAPVDVASNYRKTNMTYGGYLENEDTKYDFDNSPSPKSSSISRFSLFPVKNSPKKPKDITVKLGLYSPTNSEFTNSTNRS